MPTQADLDAINAALAKAADSRSAVAKAAAAAEAAKAAHATVVESHAADNDAVRAAVDGVVLEEGDMVALGPAVMFLRREGGKNEVREMPGILDARPK